MRTPSDVALQGVERVSAELELMFEISSEAALADVFDAVIRLRYTKGWPIDFRSIEREVIQETLRCAHGNKTKAAAILGISLRRLQYRLKEYRTP